MKRMKKIFAVILSLAMVMGMSLTAFATGDTNSVTGTNSDKGTIKVKGVDTGLKVYAYKIVKAKYDNPGGGFSGYAWADEVADIDGIGDLEVIPAAEDSQTKMDTIKISREQLAKISDVKYSEIAVAANEMEPSGSDYTKSNLDVGSYLIVVGASESKIYTPMVASIYYTLKADNAGNDIAEGIITDVASAKVNDHPTLTKKAQSDTSGDPSSVKIGGTVNYTLDINPIPYYGGSNAILKVTDTLSEGLDLVTTGTGTKSGIKVEIGEMSGDVFVKDTQNGDLDTSKYDVDFDTTTVGDTTTVNNRKFTVDFVTDAGYQLNDYQGKVARIIYSVTVNDNAKVNNDANTNEANITYSKDSNVENGDPETPDTPQKTYSYTFDLSGTISGEVGKSLLNKQDPDISGDAAAKALAGAEFTLYTDEQCTTKYTNSATVKGSLGELNNATLFDGSKGTATSDNSGNIYIKGLAAGTYFLKETKAPEGYSLNEHAYKIVISATYYTAATSSKAVGELKTCTITIDDQESPLFKIDNDLQNPVVNNGETNGVINNTKLSTLPSTGGIGTTIFTIGGCAIMIIAAALFFASRRKSAK